MRREVVGAWLLLAGFAALWLGVAWDGQWHVDVGPDTFFTAPHLMFYFGTALIGTTSLVVVLGGRRSDGAVRVFGFHAPPAFLVAGLGAAGHLVYGAADLWWHTIYGFDILESTPSHLSLQLAMHVQAVGVTMAFAALRTTTSGRWGLVLAGAFGVGSGAILLDGAVFGVKLGMLALGGIAAWTVCAVMGITRSVRWAFALASAFLVVQAATFLFPPVVTGLYADGIGQPIRDDALGIPLVALAMPVAFPVVAALAAGVVSFARKRYPRPDLAMAVAGAVVGLGAALPRVIMDDDSANAVLGVVAVTVLGAVAGRFGWPCAVLMRRLGPKEVAA
ncbi:hypothetical protein GCM10022243_09460 [Saccharothrix violaceirubra]|uniref:Uncharacterized protein n=1 Tax=Saccharothrix violaceirubra TaxID=413306 RepID=A0A7W7T478_9PSEU|nr:hypothetical protein [Saccharothrix violaceirubra]MBB4966216.1 hypothetical protein [Saccharothrix violaceirubra]